MSFALLMVFATILKNKPTIARNKGINMLFPIVNEMFSGLKSANQIAT